MGWAETVVTSVYEYREVACSRSIRAGKMLVQQLHRLLARALTEAEGKQGDDGAGAEESRGHVVSFEECEEVASRMLWCKAAIPSAHGAQQEEGLPTVTETDESEAGAAGRPETPDATAIRLVSTFPPRVLNMPYGRLAEPCENAFFEKQYAPASWDDHELPIHLLIYDHLLQLPLDVRGVCMSASSSQADAPTFSGLRGRILDELATWCVSAAGTR